MIDGPRGLKPEELDKLLEDVVNIVYSPRMKERFPTLFCAENADSLRIIKTDGRIVSHTGVVVRDMVISGCRISVGNVGAVCTHGDYRKRGYAWSIFEDAMDKFRAKGVDMFLVSGSRTLYRLHGCTHVGRVVRYKVTREMKFPDTGAEVRLFKSEDLPAWATLHRNEPVRFHRPYDDFQKLTARSLENRGGLLYSIWAGNRIAAYAVLGRTKYDGNEVVYFNEYAGSRRALVGAIRSWFQVFDVPFFAPPVPAHDVEFIDLLDSIGAELTGYGNSGGTITILDFPRLCSRLMPMFEEVVGRRTVQKLTFDQQDGLYYVRLGDDEMALDDAHDVARLIFGNPGDRDERTEITAQGELHEVLEAIFPIPRPAYGLSYI